MEGGNFRKEKKDRLIIFIATMSLICSIGLEKIVIREVLTSYEKSILFLLIWLCLNKIFND